MSSSLPAVQHAAGPSTLSTKKRKSRGGASIPSSSSGRVTRRTVAIGVGEPSRGDEENLIKYEGNGTKRARHQSPSSAKAAPPPNIANIPLQIDPALWDASNAFEGLEGLQSFLATTSATASVPPPIPPRPRLPYPIGLTPYRYQCHHPDVPPPPPGDPNNPKFKRFDPTYISPPAHPVPTFQTREAQNTPSLPQQLSIPATPNAPQFHQPQSFIPTPGQSQTTSSQLPHIPTQNQQTTPIPPLPQPEEKISPHTPFQNLYDPTFPSNDAYESLTALLNASDDNTNLLPDPPTPGERIDGQIGALPAELQGKYIVGSKMDCELCLNRVEGHGHWVKSDSAFTELGLRGWT